MLERRQKLLSVAGVVFGGALLLSACGNASHVVSDASSGTTPTSMTTGATTSVTSKKASSKPTGSSSARGDSPSPVSQQTLNGLDSQLEALSQSLSQAVGSVDNTQGDS